MKRVFLAIISILILAIFSTCEKFDFNPATKVKTLDATPELISLSVTGKIVELSGIKNDDYGVCYASHADPTVDDNIVSAGKPKVGEFTTRIENLEMGDQIYVRVYCKDGDEYVYGDVKTATLPSVTVTTSVVTEITHYTAKGGGSVSLTGTATITQRGVCWSTNQLPTIPVSKASNMKAESSTAKNGIDTDAKAEGKSKSANQNPLVEGYTSDGSGTGDFTSNISELRPSTTFYVRAYAKVGDVILYGDEKTFTTPVPVPPTVETNTVTSVGVFSATVSGNVQYDGGAEVITKGVCWSKIANPTIDGNHEEFEGVDGVANSFSIVIDGLEAAETYYVRTYAQNSVGVGYGEQLNFTTLDGVIMLITNEVFNITATTAASGGYITTDGGTPISTRGVVWSTSQNPTVDSNQGITSNGTGTGNYISNLTDLTPGVTYYVRAYSTNSVGTSYGNQQFFTTLDGIITLTTTAVTSITATTASSGGNITSDGGATITTRGTVWSASQDPTVEINQGITSNGIGIGTFSSNLTNLTPNTTYYVRAYASNSLGMIYGNQHIFTTTDGLPTISTNAVNIITDTTAISGGNVTSHGGFAITARGVVWSTSQNPTINSNLGITSNGMGTGTFTSNLTGLLLNSTYFVRAYATNSMGTSYGDQIVYEHQFIIGKVYQGGVIAYILQPSDPGYIAGEVHGLIAAPSDQGVAEWGCVYTHIGTSFYLYPNFGTGMANTILIVNGCSTPGIAARLCYDLVLNGYNDWFLPSCDELRKLYPNKNIIGGFNEGDYWSSNDAYLNEDDAIFIKFLDGSQWECSRSFVKNVRAIRTF